MPSSPRIRTALVAVALIVLLMSAQAVASATVPADERTGTGRVLGQTGFAFLGGMRTFGAAVLWNRLDPTYHGFYRGTSVREQSFMLPSLRVITALDPQFTKAYYYAGYAVAAVGDVETGIEIAREGVAQNPDSGLMRANLVQLLMMQDKVKNLPEMVRESNAGLEAGMHYDSADDAFESLVIYRTAFTLNGDETMADRITQAVEELKASGQLEDDHDHDHDGVQDH